MFHINRRWFTLAELMIVIWVIGILAAALFPSLSNYLDRAVFAGQLKSMLDMNWAIQTYYNDKGKYPDTQGVYANPYGCYGSAVWQFTEQNWIPWLVEGGYISKLPDPQSGSKNCISLIGNFFIYISNFTNDGYKLISHGRKTVKYVVSNRVDLLDPQRDGWVNNNIVETWATLVPWAWAFWTDGMEAW